MLHGGWQPRLAGGGWAPYSQCFQLIFFNVAPKVAKKVSRGSKKGSKSAPDQAKKPFFAPGQASVPKRAPGHKARKLIGFTAAIRLGLDSMLQACKLT